ncbi:MAG: hypothetical protein A2117_01605 [Candidatus Wildermuthbacteria bacterium GWA2_46_15]|uniref:Enolase n=1 Tax=Candidatus Wildermuthbacteria bacterium GWA2_46_15 TaxID=1802443 RepID=A0A1G2QR39_9BACT|nr:MAG: hypothetical protein A2117_01605 [Candidatus Wildermuthbacteria bacterium GWA2_46_15]
MQNYKAKFKIDGIKAGEILDSRGQATVEVKMKAEGRETLASIPSGTSVGKYEAPVLKTEKAVLKINQLTSLIIKKKFSSQSEFDQYLKNRTRFANVSLPLSIAFSRAFRTLPRPSKRKMPRLMILAFEGGVHSNSSLQIQEFLMVAGSVKEGLRFYQKLKQTLEKKGIDTDVGLEGGFAPNNLSDSQALEILRSVLPVKTKIGLDFGGSYYRGSRSSLAELMKRFSVFAIEDPFSEDDLKNWRDFYQKYGRERLVIGDDLVVTNIGRLKMALKPKLINAVIVKPNQIGTVSETLDFICEAKQNELAIIISHRSGETNDSFIAELALAVGADFVKFGGLARGERMAKYNQLL